MVLAAWLLYAENMTKPMPNASLMQISRDRRLVKRILAGDEKAFRQFFDEYFPRLYRYARHRLRCEADVEDVVQVVLAQAARRMETFRGESTLLTWLIQICRHEISKQLQQAQTHSDMMLPFLNDDLLCSIVESIEADPQSSPEHSTRRIELISLIQFSLDQLPEHYATALELKYVEGWNSKDIASRLKISDEAMQSLLARARRAFKDVCGEALQSFGRGSNYGS